MRITGRRWAKWAAIGFGGFVALLLLAAFVLTQLVDPDRYRGLIERQVADATGRGFRLEGDIELAFFPWLSLTTGAAELASPPGFPDPRFLRWRSAHVGVRLVPLLRGELIVDRVRLKGLDAHLVKAADGRVNWAFGGEANGAGEAGEAPRPLPEIAGIELRESQLAYDDAAGGTRVRLDSVKVDIGPIRQGEPMRVRAGATVSMPGHAERVTVNVATVVTRGAPVALTDTKLGGELLGGRFADDGVPWKFAAPEIRYEAADGALSVPRWELGFAKARIRGTTTATLGEVPEVTATLELAPVSLRDTLAAAGITLPPTRDPAAYRTVRLDAGLHVSGYSFQVDPLDVVLDDTHFAGSVMRDTDEDGVIRFALRGDRMDIGRYLEPEGAPGEPFVFPAAELATLRVEGAIELDEATLDGVKMRGVRLGAGR